MYFAMISWRIASRMIWPQQSAMSGISCLVEEKLCIEIEVVYIYKIFIYYFIESEWSAGEEKKLWEIERAWKTHQKKVKGEICRKYTVS